MKQESQAAAAAAAAAADENNGTSSNSNSDNVANNLAARPPPTDHQLLMNEALQVGDVNNRRLFSFKDKAPAAPDFHQNPLRVVYSIPKTPLTNKTSSRYIPQSPERILDAPDIINDYCTN